MQADLWHSLCFPLLRILLGLSVGLFFAQTLEALNWTAFLTRLAKPLSKAAHLSATARSTFSLAFFSPVSANALLSEHYQAGTLTKRELVLANLFNSFPAYLVHTPTLFFLSWPILGASSLIYVGLSLLAAVLRTLVALLFARHLLPMPAQGSISEELQREKPSMQKAFTIAIKKFRQRIPKLFFWTIPAYLLIYYLQVSGLFNSLNKWLSSQSIWTSYFSPQAASIIVLHCLAEFGSALGACGSLLSTGALNQKEIILALLIGNILSTPIRALRHQLPSYAGLFSPALGFELIILNQTLRACSMAVVTILYVIVAS